MRRDSFANTIRVAVLLCLVCSLVVSSAAVFLRGKQQANKADYMRRNILEAAGLWREGADVDELFQQIQTRIVDLQTGRFVEDAASLEIDSATYDQRKAIRDPRLSKELSDENDIAGIQRRERYSYVYLVKKNDAVDQIVLPIRGYGLWSTLWGFLALDAKSLKQGPVQVEIRGITFYQHAETPGLGGEVDNPRWKAQWNGKHVFDESWNVELEVTKGATSEYEVDALSGATITSRGVTNMIHFWMGEKGFGPLLVNLHENSFEQVAAGVRSG